MKKARPHRPAGVLLFSVLLTFSNADPCAATELNQKTIEAFDHYVRVTEARQQEELRSNGPFLWLDSLPDRRRTQLYDRLRHGQLAIRQERIEENGKPIGVPDGLIHDWVGTVFVPGVSLEKAVSLLQDYDNHRRTYAPEVRRSKLLEHADNSFKVYLQFYKESPKRVSFNAVFEIHYHQIDATRAASRAASVRIAELQHPEQPDSPEFPVGKGHGYLWRMNNYWRLEEKDGGVYVQVESIALSRDVPAILAWFVNPLIRRVSRQAVASLLNATRRGLVNSTIAKGAKPGHEAQAWIPACQLVQHRYPVKAKASSEQSDLTNFRAGHPMGSRSRWSSVSARECRKIQGT